MADTILAEEWQTEYKDINSLLHRKVMNACRNRKEFAENCEEAIREYLLLTLKEKQHLDNMYMREVLLQAKKIKKAAQKSFASPAPKPIPAKNATLDELNDYSFYLNEEIVKLKTQANSYQRQIADTHFLP